MRTRVLDPDEAVSLGRAVVADGRLVELRQQLGITRSAMSEMLFTNLMTYADWERHPDKNLRPATAARVGRFYAAATEQLSLLSEDGLQVQNLVPFHVVATLLGIPQELLLQWYRDERLEAVDLGILGLWVEKPTLRRLRERR